MGQTIQTLRVIAIEKFIDKEEKVAKRYYSLFKTTKRPELPRSQPYLTQSETNYLMNKLKSKPYLTPKYFNHYAFLFLSFSAVVLLIGFTFEREYYNEKALVQKYLLSKDANVRMNRFTKEEYSEMVHTRPRGPSDVNA
ncbi:hypothetical protein ABK040_015537 [Willaertia magna]